MYKTDAVKSLNELVFTKLPVSTLPDALLEMINLAELESNIIPGPACKIFNNVEL